MSRTRPLAGPTISLFPFLAVLLCMMGALLVLLVRLELRPLVLLIENQKLERGQRQTLRHCASQRLDRGLHLDRLQLLPLKLEPRLHQLLRTGQRCRQRLAAPPTVHCRLRLLHKHVHHAQPVLQLRC